MKKVIIPLLILTLLMAYALSSCEWFKTEEPHECASLCTECGGCLNRECEDSACAEKCEGHIPPHECEHLCEECDGCLDAECKEDSCTEKCSCHNEDTLCPECGGCVYTGCKEAICLNKCSCEKLVNVSEELVAALTKHLDDIYVCYDMTVTRTESKIDEINRGRQPLLDTFDTATTYYVGVYFYGEHHLPDYPYESGDYCCSDYYVWVRFDNAEEIGRTYNGRNLLAAFVISETESVTNIFSGEVAPKKFVLFNMFYRFLFMEDEIEVPEISGAPFIYLNRNANADTIYYYQKSYDRRHVTLPCTKIDEKYYIEFRLITWNAEDITKDFGKYYDALSAVIEPGIYKSTDEYGNILDCYLIEVENFAEVIKGE